MHVVLWPFDMLGNDLRGYCYGWVHPLLCVAGIIHVDSAEEAEQTLSSLCDAQNLKWMVTLKEDCGSLPIIIGWCSSNNLTREYPDLHLNLSEKLGSDFRGQPSIVYYRRPNPRSMEIYDLDFHIYDLSSFINKKGLYDQSGRTLTLTTYDPTKPSRLSCSLDRVVVNQLNHSAVLHETLTKLSGVSQYSQMSLRNHFFSFVTFIKRGCASLKAVRGLDKTSIHKDLVNGESTPLKPFGYGRETLSKISAFCHQLDVRIEQVIAIPPQVPQLYGNNSPTSGQLISRYVNFWNDVWLILNDVIIGIALGSFLCENSLILSHIVEDHLQNWLIKFPQNTLVWLNSWPAGLKLNTELSQFYCHSLLGLIIVWAGVLRSIILPYLPDIFYVIGACGFAGMTMAVSTLSDLLSILTLHLHLCYLVSSMVFSRQLTIAGSLWNLFRGKRYNILRKRKDSRDYDVDQLLLGTILFTLVTFLSPTVITYYALFAMIRFIIVLVHAVLDTILVLMNHFPLFALLLRLKNPLRMPGGLTFRLTGNDSPPIIEIQPIPFARIFDHYIYLGSRLSSHYHPLRLLRLVLRGGPLTTIPRSFIRLRTAHKRTNTV